MGTHDVKEIQRADPQLRKRALVMVLVIAVAGAVALLILQGVLADLRMLRGNDFERARDALAAAFLWSIAASALLTVPAGIYLWRMGSRIRSALQFPPPGLRVIRDTVVVHGEPAARRGRALQGLAVLLVLSMGALLAIAARLHALLGTPVAS